MATGSQVKMYKLLCKPHRWLKGKQKQKCNVTQAMAPACLVPDVPILGLRWTLPSPLIHAPWYVDSAADFVLTMVGVVPVNEPRLISR